jgi:lincosamide nucleotidyltransferase A/C/D/E
MDALLGVQTRPHKDMDIFVRLEDVQPMRELLSHEGYTMKEIWSENHWKFDAKGAAIATAFVLRGMDGREVDAHALRLDEQGNGLPAWVTEVGFVLTRRDLAGDGQIAGCPVRCITAQMQVKCHAGYELPYIQLGDLRLLDEKFDQGLDNAK